MDLGPGSPPCCHGIVVNASLLGSDFPSPCTALVPGSVPFEMCHRGEGMLTSLPFSSVIKGLPPSDFPWF